MEYLASCIRCFSRNLAALVFALCLVSQMPVWSAVLIEQGLSGPGGGLGTSPLKESKDLFDLDLSLTPEQVQQRDETGISPRLLEAIKMEYASKNFTAALKLLDAAIRQLPDNEELLLVKLGIVIELRRWDKARDVALEILKLDSRSVKAYTVLGYVALEQNLKEEAIKHYEKLNDLLPYNGQGRVRTGLIYFALENYGAAEMAFARAIELAPDFAPAHNYLGVLRYRQERYDEAVALHQAALELDPKLAEAYNHLGSALFNLGKYDEALAAYQKAISLRPQFTDALTNLGACLAAKERSLEAFAALMQSLQWKIDQPLAWRNLLLAMDKFVASPPPEDALAEAEKLDAEGYYKQALALVEQKNFKQALYYFVRALRMDINNPSIHNDLGVVLAAGGQPALGYAFLQAALYLKPDYADAMRNLQQVVMADQQQQLRRAYNQLIAYTQENPTNAMAQAQLGVILANTGNITNALERMSIAVEHAPTNQPIRVERARLLFLNGRVDDALADITALKDANPENDWVLHQYAWLITKKTDPHPEEIKEAIRAARLAIKAKGNDLEYLQTLARLYEGNGKISSTIKITKHALSVAESTGNTNAVKMIKIDLERLAPGG